MKNIHPLIKFKSILIVFLIAFVFVCTVAKSQVLPPDDPYWEIVFQDTFPGSSTVDTAKWLSNWIWNQKQYTEYSYWIDSTEYYDTITNEDYKPYSTFNFSNVSVDSGFCTITARKENYSGMVTNWPPYGSDSCAGHDLIILGNGDSVCRDEDYFPYHYTTGMLLSKDLFKYGYFEISARVRDSSAYKQNLGIGPNFWMWAADDTTAWSEIDIYEIAGEFDSLSNYHTTNVHYKRCNVPDSSCWTSSPGDTLHLNYIYKLQNIKFNNNFKKFSTLWIPDSITNFYEGSKYGSWVNCPIDPKYLIPMPLVADIAFPTVNFPYHQYQLPDTNYLQLPYEYDIDYIKVWQPKEYCDSSITVNNFNPSTFDYAIYKDITFTGTNTIPDSSNVILKSTDGFLFNGDFTVEAGAEFLGQPTPCMNPVKVTSSKSSSPPPDSFQKRLIKKNIEP